MVRCCVDWELVTLDEEVSASVGLVSLSVGIGRVVIIWVTSLEKNFSSLYAVVRNELTP